MTICSPLLVHKFSILANDAICATFIICLSIQHVPTFAKFRWANNMQAITKAIKSGYFRLVGAMDQVDDLQDKAALCVASRCKQLQIMQYS
jgi:hypothetical protein